MKNFLPGKDKCPEIEKLTGQDVQSDIFASRTLIPNIWKEKIYEYNLKKYFCSFSNLFLIEFFSKRNFTKNKIES